MNLQTQDLVTSPWFTTKKPINEIRATKSLPDQAGKINLKCSRHLKTES